MKANKQRLHQLMTDSFSFNDLEVEICQPLHVDLENISGRDSNKRIMIFDLIEYFDRDGRLEHLLDVCQKVRVNRDWSSVYVDAGDDIDGADLPPKPTSAEGIEYNLPQAIETEEYQRQSKQLSAKLGDINFPDPSLVWGKISALKGEATIAETDRNYEEAAQLYAELAKLHEQEKHYIQARDFARKAATCLLETNDKEGAIKQYLFAAEIWMNHTAFAAVMANADLEKAKKIAEEIKNFTLLARVFLLQAHYNILQGTRQQTEKMWQQAESLFPKIDPAFYIELSTELAIQKAMIARLDGETGVVKNFLETASARDWPARFDLKHLELLWSLLFFYSEIGAWQDVDRVYKAALELLTNQDESHRARWLMHYAASLARRGEGKEAYRVYLEALDFFTSKEAASQDRHHFFQDMIHSLARNASHDVFATAMEHDKERLDLILNSLHEDVGHLHRASARRSHFEGDIDSAFNHAQYAFMYAWRKGDWSGIVEAKKIRAFLAHANQDYVSATFTAIGAVPHKVIKKYAIHLNDLTNPAEIQQLIDDLLQTWPTPADFEDVFVALAQCTDIVPSDQLERVFQFTVDILQRYLTADLNRNPCQSAIQALRRMAARFDQTQTEKLIQFSTESLDAKKPVPWTIKSEFIELLGACFNNGSTIQPKFYERAMTAILAYHDKDSLRTEVEFTLLSIAIQAPTEVRDKITAFFRERSNWFYLAVLNESIPEESVKRQIETILRAITPQRQNGGISFSGLRVQSINNFNEYLTSPSLRTLVIDGLLMAIKNPDGFLTQKSGAILTLRWLPETVLREKSSEITQLLLEVANGEYIPPKKDFFLNWFGNEEEIRRNSLYTLGRMYALVKNPLKKQIHDQLLSSSRSPSSAIRMGTAMALRTLEGSYTFSTALTFTLIELLQDEDPGVRHWAASAVGHRIADGKIPKKPSEFIIQRLLKAAEYEQVAHARAGVAYGLRTLSESDNLPESFRDQVQEARSRLLNDVNDKVVRLASGP